MTIKVVTNVNDIKTLKIRAYRLSAPPIFRRFCGNVGYLDGNKHLIGIDVHWDTMGEGEGLLITNGVRTRLTYDGESKELLDIPTGK